MPVASALRSLIGDDGALDAAETATRSAGFMRPDRLKAQALARPRTSDEIAAVLRWCHANSVSVVTQGGLTGLVHGADAEPEPLVGSCGSSSGTARYPDANRAARPNERAASIISMAKSRQLPWPSRSVSTRRLDSFASRRL